MSRGRECRGDGGLTTSLTFVLFTLGDKMLRQQKRKVRAVYTMFC